MDDLAVLAAGADPFVPKHLQFINLVQGNLLQRTIYMSDIKVNVFKFLIETKFVNHRCLHMRVQVDDLAVLPPPPRATIGP